MSFEGYVIVYFRGYDNFPAGSECLYFRNNCRQIKPSLNKKESSFDHVVKSHVIKLTHFVKITIANRSVKKSLLHPFYIARIDFHSFCADADIDPVEGSIHSDF